MLVPLFDYCFDKCVITHYNGLYQQIITIPYAMTKADKKNQKIRRNPNNVKFQDLMSWLEDNGFVLDRAKGSHHVFVHPVIETPINVQKKKDGTAKAYQVKQAIKIIDGE